MFESKRIREYQNPSGPTQYLVEGISSSGGLSLIRKNAYRQALDAHYPLKRNLQLCVAETRWKNYTDTVGKSLTLGLVDCELAR